MASMIFFKFAWLRRRWAPSATRLVVTASDLVSRSATSADPDGPPRPPTNGGTPGPPGGPPGYDLSTGSWWSGSWLGRLSVEPNPSGRRENPRGTPLQRRVSGSEAQPVVIGDAEELDVLN